MIGLTVGVIVRNDAARLDRALTSVRGVASEIVVVDTGSTDASIEVARRHGARVKRSTWREDFAASYNQVLAMVDPGWLLSLDADEYLLAESVEAVRDAVTDPTAAGYDVIRRDYLERDGCEPYCEIRQLRLFRVPTGTRYVGRIHHQFDPPLETIAARQGRAVRAAPIVLGHTGYVNRDWATKHRRDAALMEAELRDRPGGFYYLVELGLTRLKLGDAGGVALLAEAAELALDESRVAGLPRSSFVQLLEWVLAGEAVPADFPIDSAWATRMTEQHFRQAPPLAWQLARRAYAGGNWAQAETWLRLLIRLGESGDYERVAAFDPRVIGDEARLNLAACIARAGRHAEAEAMFEKLASSPRVGRAAVANLRALRESVEGE